MSAIVRMTGVLDPRDAWTADECPMAATLDLVSARSAFLLLRELFYGATRFDELVARTGLSEPVVAGRLRELVDHGLLAREDYRDPGQRTRQRYVLTPAAEDLLPLVVALVQWGNRWAFDGRGSPVELRHRDCREPVRVELRCGAGHDVAPDELDLALRRGRRAPTES